MKHQIHFKLYWYCQRDIWAKKTQW